MNIKTTLLTLCMLATYAGSKAQAPLEYYVDISQASNGNGTAGSPWNRIWYAINRSPRDTTKDAIVYLKRGSYIIDSTQFLTQLYVGADQGGANGKYLTLKPYPGDEGKVIIDGKDLATTSFFPNMFVISGAKYIKLQNLVFRNLKNTSGYVLNIQNAQNIEISNCAFDSLYWTTTGAEYGYPTVNDKSNFIHPVYLAGNSTVTLSQDSLKNAAIGWGDFIRDAGGNSSVTTTSLFISNTTPVASDYYVALTGNDTTGSGSVAKPWRTIKRANDLAGINYTVVPSALINAPVTIYLRAGTHKPAVNGIFINSNRGVNGQWYTIKNYPGETVIVDGSDITAKFSALFSIGGAKFVRIEGLKLTKMTNDSTLTDGGIKDTRFGIIVSGKAANIIIKKNEIYDMAWTRNLSKQKIPEANDNLNPLVVLGTTDTSIRNVIIDSNSVYENITGYAEAVTVNGNVDSFAITNNLVFDNANIGIVAAGNYQWVVDDPNFSVTATHNFSKNGFIRNNTVYRNISPIAVSAGIYLDGSRYVTVEDNLSYNNGTGISVGNEQYNSVSGYHMVRSNVLRDNLTAGLYYGSTNSTSWVEYCTVKWNTIKDNYVLDSVLRAKANNQYGITNASQRYTEANIYRLRNSTFEENTIESLSDIVLGYYRTQSNLTIRYNEYYVISENACQAIFVQDKNDDGSIASPPDSIYTNFHQYAKRTGYDQNSECEGEEYDPNGCGLASRGVVNPVTSKPIETLNNKLAAISAYPNPVINRLSVRLGMKGNGTVNLALYNISGQLVLQQQRQLSEGNHELGWNDTKQKLIPGVYLLKVSTPFEKKNIKILVK
ncbi:MAG TPA: T9SS type A sorting domain-containing protein [Chitinophagaceae bacterium]|nr:T9SS type A sorting domain-containing protein [Chitinophagaceae bacterium]